VVNLECSIGEAQVKAAINQRFLDPVGKIANRIVWGLLFAEMQTRTQ
jgi:hypothetical protein